MSVAANKPGCNGDDTGSTRMPDPLEDPWRLREEPAYTPRKKLRIITVGAGFSGLMLAHKLQHQYPEMQELVSHTIFEARADIGGTWLANVYPGVQCDVPAHVYAFPFDPNPSWSHFYATGKEIHDYIKNTTRKWNLDRDIKLKHRVLAAAWHEDLGQWKVTVESEGRTWQDNCDILISAQGVLNSWSWPQIDGLHEFKGFKTHSASWDHGFDYSNKRIAIIGNGSTGVQIIPELAKLPGTEILSFQRSTNWVYSHITPAALLGKSDPSPCPAYTEEEKRRFIEDPAQHKEYRRRIIHNVNKAFGQFVKGSARNNELTSLATQQMTQRLKGDPELCKALIPNWPLGCRRITPAEGYLETFLQPNTHLITSEIERINEKSIRTKDGKNHEIDVLVCATGYAVDWKPQWQMVGRKNVDLGKEWTVDPQSYLSVAAPDMPNYFMFLGPNAVVAHGSIIEAINWTGDYIVKWLRKIATEDIKSVVPKSKAVADFIRYGTQIHNNLVWSAGCRSWFKRNTIDGRVIAAFPGSALLFKRLISEIRAEDFELEYRTDNQWWFFGSGFTSYELGDSNDLAWYIER